MWMAQGIVKEVFASRKSSMRNGRNTGMICKTTSSWQVPRPQEEEEEAEALCAHRELCGEESDAGPHNAKSNTRQKQGPN